MLGSSSPAAATLSTNTSSATPTSPTRPTRLRGLSYLRNYTHNHLHSHSSTSPRSSAPPLVRAATSPVTPRSTTPRPDTPNQHEDRENTALSPQRSDSEGHPTNGWVPTVRGQSGLSRLATQPQSTSTSSVGAEHTPVSAMTRSRAATAVDRTSSTMGSQLDGTQPVLEAMPTVSAQTEAAESIPGATNEKKDHVPSIRFIPHHEPRATRPSLSFPIITRVFPNTSATVKVGRYSERDNNAADALTNPNSTAPVGFKSKVVSRRHCELWCANNQWYIKDVKSSSGTFLNHVRLSSPGQESRPYPVNDGDIVQLGIDFKGGEEIIFRCVKIRIECNRGWQKGLNNFNTSTHKRLQNLAKTAKGRDSDAQSTHSSECSICLNPVAPCQALFVAPCSHVWHYKCVRNLIYPAWPTFQCPNCRAYADLEADVDQPEMEDTDEELDSALKRSEDDAAQGSESDGHNQAESQTPSRHGTANSVASEDELSSMMNSTSLSGSSRTPSTTGQSSLDTSAATSQPMTIVASTNAPLNDITDPIRSATPTSTAQFALAAGILANDGPMTPRNDVGPFVLDGSGGRGREVGDIVSRAFQE